MDPNDGLSRSPYAGIFRAAALPGGIAILLIGMHGFLPSFGLTSMVVEELRRIIAAVLVADTAWLGTRLIRVLSDLLLTRFRTDVRDNLRARRAHTQIEIVRKIVTVSVWFVAFASVLTMFEQLREVGAGLLASAGIAGIVLGLAAQKTLGNLIAGFQIAFTQPIRLDDAVVVEGEWGWIEEITLTYVVVRIWDLRRLVIPIVYFIEKPVQNWTRTSASILGSVLFYVDYRVPADDVRDQLATILEESAHWDGEVSRLHVTEAREGCVEMRALVSAADSPTAWELRCEVREKLLAWLREQHPTWLPRIRAELGSPAEEAVA